MRIVIGSAGRRVYLVRWFQEALRSAGIEGQIYVLENDKNAASVAVADGFVHMPRYEDPKYRAAILYAIDNIRPHLFFSLNDYELTHLSGGLAEDIRERGVIVPSLTREAQAAVADKLAMFEKLRTAGINTPQTVLLSDFENVEKLLLEAERVIIKDRFGSGSSGLQRVDSRELLAKFKGLPPNNYELKSTSKLDSLVVQPDIPGDEYGLDVVTPLTGGALAGVLARRKIAMRNGETNVAVTVDPHKFETLASRLADAFESQGIVDVDVIQTTGGEHQVIDINPRFGGGYPFNHAAGADVPHYYLAFVAGFNMRSNWNEYYIGSKSAKYEELTSLGSN